MSLFDSVNTQAQRLLVRHVFVVADRKGRRNVSLDAVMYSIGRDPSCAIVIYSEFVSRKHAILLRVPSADRSRYEYRLMDGSAHGQPSTNGIWVNGQRTQSHDLKHGDAIIFSRDVSAHYYVTANLSDREFESYTQSADFRSLKLDSEDSSLTTLEGRISS
jgi:pSer/pThr/pTyr-binding forkhead associated (FHA) protein